MSEWATGYSIGIISGLVIGLVATRKKKPWAELTDKEKRIRARVIVMIAVLAIAGILLLAMVT